MPEIIQKITYGFVNQRFEDGKFTGQEFIAGDQTEYEDNMGNVLDQEECEEKIEYSRFKMLNEPKLEEIKEKIQKELNSLLSEMPWETQTKACKIVLDNLNKIVE